VVEPSISSNPDSVSSLILPDGSQMTYRRIRPSDAEALQRLHDTLSPTTVHQRFFGAMLHLGESMARTFTHVDGKDRVALVALDPMDASNIIGVARYDRIGASHSAEYACVITDHWQGHGVGTALSVELLRIARHNGIRSIDAVILADNRAMIEMLINLGLPYTMTWEYDTTTLSLDISGDGLVGYLPPQSQS
jgi:RimJ/RimL family protein N-acetyltransferase